VAYTDVNDTWKLPDRRQRLAVSAAGVLTELVVAAWATLAWSLLPDGALRNGAFLLAAITWISTVAVNASPFMRFDGYFLLSDWLDIPNLHARAFALARWKMRAMLFGLNEEPPEHFPKSRARFLLLFAWITWAYRLVLFLGIAVLVYRHFFKALGAALFLVEITWFVALPVGHELREWCARWPMIRASRRAHYTAASAAALLVLCFVPLDPRVGGQGLLKPVRSMDVFAPQAGLLIVAPRHKHGEAVSEGEELLRMTSAEQEEQAALARLRLSRIKTEVAVATMDRTSQIQLPVLRESSAAAESEVIAYAREQARLTPRATFSGVWIDAATDLHAGDSVARNELLGTVIDPARWNVKTYLQERDVLRVSVGDTALFYPETAGMPPVQLKVTSIDRDASRELPEPLLASTAGGQVSVRAGRSNGVTSALIPESSIYGVTLAAVGGSSATVPRELRGEVVIRGRAQSVLGRYLETLVAVVIRESGA
jgi:putative peptide zinc metalloprotease protein